jgi:TM2 domain-containing membrane protein YozV
MKKFLMVFAIGFVALFAAENANGQNNNYQDIVYLKNGDVIKGIIIEQIPNVSLKIETTAGIFNYQMSDVEKITKEQMYLSSVPVAAPQKIKEPILSWFLSFAIPGVGQIYNGDKVKGTCFLIGAFACYLGMYVPSIDHYLTEDEAAVVGFSMLGYLTLWIWSQIDAPIRANKINLEHGYLSWNVGKNTRLSISPDIQYNILPIQNNSFASYGGKISISF